jgi:hypothetical protein
MEKDSQKPCLIIPPCHAYMAINTLTGAAKVLTGQQQCFSELPHPPLPLSGDLSILFLMFMFPTYASPLLIIAEAI